MAKKPKPISVNATQTKTYDIDHDASSYAFGSKFKLTSATVTTGIDNATDVLATTMSFGGKINLTGATGTITGINLDVLGDSSISITRTGSISASSFGIHADAALGVLKITNAGVVNSTAGIGIAAVNDSGLAGSLLVTNLKTISGMTAGVAISEDGAILTNGKTGKISGLTGVLINDDNVFNDTYGLAVEAFTTIDNQGQIKGGAGGWSIRANDASIHLTNGGTLDGNVRFSGNGKDSIVNAGMIIGNIDTGDGNDVVNNVLLGSVSGDVLLGNGDDVFIGTLGSGKSVYGGDGNDIFQFGTTIGTVIELTGEGHDTMIAAARIDLSLNGNIENASLLGTADLDIVGNIQSNNLLGNSGKNNISGSDGNDVIDGKSGNDTLGGGNGNDTIDGDDGDDMITGDDGNDNLDGGLGNDTIYGGNGNDTLDGGEGNDTMNGDAGADTLSGGNGDDNLDGGINADDVDGGTGNDLLNGGANNDSLTGGTGADALTGGTGNDNFFFAKGDSGLTAITIDTITDFASGSDGLVFDLGPGGDKTATTGNYVEGAGGASFDTALSAANTALGLLNTTSTQSQLYALEQVGNDSYLFIDYDSNGTADEAIKLTAVTLATFDDFDIV